MKNTSISKVIRVIPTAFIFIVMVIAVSLSNAGCGDGGASTAPESSDAKLSNLQSSPSPLNETFDADTLSYTASVNNSAELLTVTATTSDDNATLSINGNIVESGSSISINLNPVLEESTSIDITVTAEDGTSQNTYTVIVTRTGDEVPVSTNARLSNLTISNGTLSPTFSSDIGDYSASVAFSVSAITVTPTSEVESSTITVNGISIVSGATSNVITLVEGDNTIITSVTAEDGITVNDYTIIVTRQSAASFGQQAYIKASNTDAGDLFGHKVALFRDTLAISAINESSNATTIDGDESNNLASNSGAVYIFIRDDTGTWSQQAYIKAPNADINDLFGSSISLSAYTLVVGAIGESSNATGTLSPNQSDNSATNAGAVYVYVRQGATWTLEAYIKASNTEANDEFGYSISTYGDTIAVGAKGEDSNATGINNTDQANNNAINSGAVYIFKRDTGIWTQEAYIKSFNTDAGDEFGYSLSLSSDNLAVSAKNESSNGIGINSESQTDNSSLNSGAVYLFNRDIDNIWTQTDYIKASNTGIDDNFGMSVSLDGQNLLVGAPYEDGITGGEGIPTDDAGSAYLFIRDGNLVWTQQHQFYAFAPEAGDLFGSSVVISEENLAISSSQEDSSATGIDGDEIDNQAAESGAVFLFTRNTNNTWDPLFYVKASNTNIGDTFGNNVSLSGDSLIIGAKLEDSIAIGIGGDQSDNSATDSGAGYIFNGLPIIINEPAKPN